MQTEGSQLCAKPEQQLFDSFVVNRTPNTTSVNMRFFSNARLMVRDINRDILHYSKLPERAGQHVYFRGGDGKPALEQPHGEGLVEFSTISSVLLGDEYEHERAGLAPLVKTTRKP